MPHIYLLFDFAADEEKAQLARHKLETWKQAFRLDKRLLYKFDRAISAETAAPSSEEEKPVKTKGAAKPGSKFAAPEAASNGSVKLLVRLGFSGHEKLSEQRWVQRIPSEEPFLKASAKVVKPDDSQFADTEKQFEDLV
jgi:hypothetical protein